METVYVSPCANSTVATQLPKRALRQIAVFGGVAGLLLSLALVAPAAHAARANGKIAWQDWSSDLFERAKREKPLHYSRFGSRLVSLVPRNGRDHLRR